MNKIVVYTAIFGGYDRLRDPEVSQLPKGVDFVCFTDTNIQSDVWSIKNVSKPLPDPTRSARMYKVLAHRFLSEYDVSIWVDGNMIIRGDVHECIKRYLDQYDMAVYDHGSLKKDARNCVYEEAKVLMSAKRPKDDPRLVKSQIKRYAIEGYPKHNGLLSSMVMFRKHNTQKVIEAMNAWWKEIETYSRRDQLSFNYIAWKLDFPFCLIKEDSTDNKYFYRNYHHASFFKKMQVVTRMVCSRIGRK